MKNLTLIVLSLCIAVSVSAGTTVKIMPASGAPQTANDFFQVGFNAANGGQYELAVKNYDLAIGLDPNRIYFYYHRGLAFKAWGKKPQAAQDFNQCISMKPIAEAYYELGLIKYDALDLGGAKAMFEAARTLKDDLDKTNFYLGVIYYRNNQFDSSEACLTRYTQMVKTHSDAYLYLATVKVKKHDFADVTKLLKLASLYCDNDWKLHLKMYDIYKEIGDKDNMLYNISMVIEMGQTKPEYYNIRAQLYMAQGETLRAQYDLDAAKANGPTSNK
ncbi:MAG: hypothetical protein JWO03_326 [Bacteroidetes bacterium]|nr:hypothetical protein [Bacteroidota bacterium]